MSDERPYDLTYLSFGAGVQSTALLMACTLGSLLKHAPFGPARTTLDPLLFPRPDVAIYADTQSELADTDKHVLLMKSWAEERGVPVIRCTAGSLEKAQLGEEASRSSGFVVSIPAFTEGGGMLRRQCTRHHKLEAIHAAVRAWLGLKHGERAAGNFRVRCLLGISRDEAQRMKPSRESWIENVYPLVDARMARWDCEDAIKAWLGPHLVPPKSSCVFCPYHGDAQWAWMQRERPDDFARAVAVDRAIRDGTRRGGDDRAYLHKDRRPLETIDFAARAAADKAQGRLFGGDGFGNECEGMCGV